MDRQVDSHAAGHDREPAGGIPAAGEHDSAYPGHDRTHPGHHHGRAQHDHEYVEHDHEYAGHDHAEHDHAEHDHAEHGGSPVARWRHRLGHLVAGHSHDSADRVDQAMRVSRDGMRALWISLLVLGATAAVQGSVVVLSGSVALLGDSLHNVADALTAVPLGLAFMIGRRAANRRYTYGYGRAEDLAGVAIVLTIAASTLLAGYEAIDRLVHPRPVTHLWVVAVAALVGFAGNEIVARYRITVGRRIGSAALVADGLHARTDGFTSLSVLLGAAGVAVGWHWADPVVGLGIMVAIALVLKDAARQIQRRLMDAVDPDLVDRAEATLRATEGVLDVGPIRMRWVGHELRAECEIAVADATTVGAAHRIAHAAEHRLIHAIPRLTAATVHAGPHAGAAEVHDLLRHHR